MIYLDAAYIAKFYVDEPDSERVRAFLVTAQPAASCVHAIAEVASVFHRKLREGTVGLRRKRVLSAWPEERVQENIDDAPSA